jgi:bifunctional DNA-binding transcriptional regulator/antitoxin component of YhaV-PrlF toxin-antitoxin module
MKWKLTVDEDGMLILPEEALKVLDWKEGDELEWIDKGDGSFELRKVDELQSPS